MPTPKEFVLKHRPKAWVRQDYSNQFRLIGYVIVGTTFYDDIARGETEEEAWGNAAIKIAKDILLLHHDDFEIVINGETAVSISYALKASKTLVKSAPTRADAWVEAAETVTKDPTLLFDSLYGG